MQTYQNELDEAESVVAEAVVALMIDDNDKTQEAAQESRIDLKAITMKYEQAKNDLGFIPVATKKLDTQIRELKNKKQEQETKIIHEKITEADMEKLKECAKAAIAELASAMCMRGSRDIHNSGIENLLDMLNKDKSVTAQMQKAHIHTGKETGLRQCLRQHPLVGL